MDTKIRKIIALGLVILGLATILHSLPQVGAQSPIINDNRSPGLQGSWRVTILSGTPNQFFSLMQFNDGGTMTEVSSSPGNTASVGAWEKIRGYGNYAATFELFWDNNSDGIVDLRFRVRQTIHVFNDDTFTGTSTLEVLTLDGTAVVAGPFSNLPFEGRRIKTLRE